MITGIDISNNNREKLKGKPICANGFIIMKASEGKTFKDKSFAYYMNKIAEESDIYGNMPFIGAYHYARPDNGNTPREEFDNYAAAIKGHEDSIFNVLDYEDLAHNYGEKWAVEYLKIAERELKKRPFFYTSASYINSHYPNIRDKYPLWLACYSQDSRTSRYKDVCARATILQVTSHPLDIDIFMGDMIDMYRFIKGGCNK